MCNYNIDNVFFYWIQDVIHNYRPHAYIETLSMDIFVYRHVLFCNVKII